MSNNNSEAGPRPASPLFSRNDPESRINDEETAIDQEASHDSDSNGTESSILPSIDVQIQQVMNHVNRPISEGQKGYLVSCRWLNRVLARCSNKDYLAGKTLAKDVTEGEIGQIDNSDLLIDSPQLKGLKDIDGQDFVPIKPGLTIGVEFEVLPEDAWNLIQRWYGLKSGCPIIIREAHNTAADSDTMENIQYELRPPVFTAVKLSHTPASVPGNDRSPVMIVASRRTSFNALLKYLKQKSGILMSTKVRVWRVIGTDGASPTDSSAATSKTKIGTNMVLPVSTFTALETGSQRELLEAKDQTSNEKYNGKATLEQYGLGSEEELVVLEEQLGGKAWCADLTPAKAAHLTGSATPGIFMSQKDKNENVSNRGKDRTSSQRDAVANNGSCNIPASAKSSIRKEENERKRKERNGVRRRKDGKAVGVTGLVNLGNTCYMNSALQCIRSVEELTRYFLADRYKEDLNPSNPLGHDGNVARAYAHLLHQLFDVHASSAFSPRQFKNVIGRYGPSFSGYGQQDSQEFIMFLLDGLQEDLNRIQKKPYIEKPDSTDDMVNDKDKLIAFADEHWRIYKARNDSVITDLFAGMYKSTLHCPECDKVSIIFDPFHNLTLQLPVENTWSHRLTFFPLYGKPITMDIEIEKNSSVKALKAHVAKKLGLASDAVARLILSEVYRSRFYRMFDNKVTLADAQIDTNDEIAMYEVESAPTSYDADYHRANQGYRSLLFSSRRDEDAHLAGEFKSSKGDRILVPIYSRLLPPKNYNNYAKPALKGHPGYAIINREEAYDYDMILKKVLGFVACLTTRDILGEAEGDALKNRQSAAPTEHEESVETDDLVDIGDEMNDVNGVGNVRAESIKSEEGVVDVSMTDAPANDGIASQNVQDSPILRILRPGAFIPAALQNIFEMKYTQTNEACPTSIGNEAAEFRTISSRLPSSRSSSQASSSGRRDVLKRTSISSTSPTGTDDEFTSAPQLERTTTITQSEVEPDSESEKTMPVGDSAGAFSSTSNSRSSSVSRSRSASRSSLHHRGQSEVKKNRTGVPLVRPGEAIILDWTEEAYDALFGSKHASKGGLRGSPTWENPEVFDDPELKAKRLQRRRVRSQGISLEDCLDEFGREEILSENDAWYCPRCKTHRRASKKFELWRTPDILVMHLKRFSSNRIFRDKLDTLVDFPQELDMTDRVMYPELGKSQKYELIAVDNHYGGLGGGHYTAYARNFVDGNWYDYN
ncbi:CSN-associated deubiquitinating enzyme Ubp12, partial [Ascosphaera aggregata]